MLNVCSKAIFRLVNMCGSCACSIMRNPSWQDIGHALLESESMDIEKAGVLD